jgi:hypothetical protein
MSALQIFRNFPQTKNEISDFKQIVKDEILSGVYTSDEIIEIKTVFKKLEEILSVMEDKDLKKAVSDALNLYTEKTVKLNGCEIQKKSLSQWNYDLCCDPILTELEEQGKEIAEKIKARKTLLQNIDGEMVFVTPDGEPQTIFKAENKSVESFAIKIL